MASIDPRYLTGDAATCIGPISDPDEPVGYQGDYVGDQGDHVSQSDGKTTYFLDHDKLNLSMAVDECVRNDKKYRISHLIDVYMVKAGIIVAFYVEVSKSLPKSELDPIIDFAHKIHLSSVYVGKKYTYLVITKPDNVGKIVQRTANTDEHYNTLKYLRELNDYPMYEGIADCHEFNLDRTFWYVDICIGIPHKNYENVCKSILHITSDQCNPLRTKMSKVLKWFEDFKAQLTSVLPKDFVVVCYTQSVPAMIKRTAAILANDVEFMNEHHELYIDDIDMIAKAYPAERNSYEIFVKILNKTATFDERIKLYNAYYKYAYVNGYPPHNILNRVEDAYLNSDS